MTTFKLSAMTVKQLVDRFVSLAIEQYQADIEDDIPRYSKLFKKMTLVKSELKSRPDDQRQALFHLYDHPNVEVRLMVAHATLALAPVEARQLLEDIAASKLFPQAGSAGMALWALDDGIYKPT